MLLDRAMGLILSAALAGCGAPDEVNVSEVDSRGFVSIRADVWVDNWFALYLEDRLLIEDSVPMTVERSFNAETFTFRADLPMQLNFVLRDFRENDTGLEYIGSPHQQIGDGGFIAQFIDTSSDELLASTNSGWRCLVLHEAPTDPTCAAQSNPVAGIAPCQLIRNDAPDGWQQLSFDDSAWKPAREHSARQVRPKGGYDFIDWREEARLIWSDNLETHNTLLCRLTVR